MQRWVNIYNQCLKKKKKRTEQNIDYSARVSFLGMYPRQSHRTTLIKGLPLDLMLSCNHLEILNNCIPEPVFCK